MARRREEPAAKTSGRQELPRELRVEIVPIDDGGHGLRMAYRVLARKLLAERGARECTQPSTSE